MKKYRVLTILAATLCLAVPVTFALVLTSNRGTWPDNWPKELEPLRERAKTVEVAHGIQETVYEISFANRAEFEKAWPLILKLKSKGAPVILEKSPSTYSRSGSTMSTGVRILWPSGGTVTLPNGTQLTSKPPWPESARSVSGELPEYVVVENGKWVPFTGGEPRGFLYRARVDIMLVLDGNIGDLNRIPLPPDTPMIDKRFEGAASDGGAAAPNTATPLVFGPVMERGLPCGSPCQAYYFQFRNGEVFVRGHGPSTTKEEDEQDQKKIKEAGGVDLCADLCAFGGEKGIQLVGEDCLFTRDLHELSWEKTTAEEVVEKMKQVNFVAEPKAKDHHDPFAAATGGGPGLVEPRAKDFPIAYLFKTARNEVGLLEILGIVEDKRGYSGDGKGHGMKFRYKLVQGGETKTLAAPKQ